FRSGAGRAVRGVAADVGAREAQHLADEVDEEETRVHFGLSRRSVDGDRDLVARHGYFPPARSTAFLSARAVSTRAISRLYSTEPDRSADGAVAAAARRAASAIVALSGFLPRR